MYRKTAAVMTVVLALAVLMPYVSLIAEADADLPVCCRGDGELKCAMRLAMAMALLPFRKPMTEATAYLGGISMHMWTWSGQRFPSVIFDSFCLASSWNILARSFLI